jgi:glycerate kinase
LTKSVFICNFTITKDRRMKIISVFDSFKGCMSSQEANEACAKGLRAQHDDVEINQIEASDGGEGFLRAMQPDKIVHCHVRDAMMRWTDADFGIKDGKAIIEVAQAVGLAKIEPELRNPLVATSYGVGELMVHAWEAGCREFVVGLGGSATSDCGLGMLKCLRHHAQQRLHQMWYDPFDTSVLRTLKVTLASDVTNPLTGPEGAAHVFAPQKGADPQQVEMLERRAVTFAKMAAKHQGYDKSREPGAGAAGGLGYAFMQFMDAQMDSGAELVLRSNSFDMLLQNADLVVTGEGASDQQTLMGKLPSVVLDHARKAGVPVVLVSGRVDNRQEYIHSASTGLLLPGEDLLPWQPLHAGHGLRQSPLCPSDRRLR